MICRYGRWRRQVVRINGWIAIPGRYRTLIPPSSACGQHPERRTLPSVCDRISTDALFTAAARAHAAGDPLGALSPYATTPLRARGYFGYSSWRLAQWWLERVTSSWSASSIRNRAPLQAGVDFAQRRSTRRVGSSIVT
jgi:hypothetical protein